jgi:hypothetical protein
MQEKLRILEIPIIDIQKKNSTLKDRKKESEMAPAVGHQRAIFFVSFFSSRVTILKAKKPPPPYLEINLGTPLSLRRQICIAPTRQICIAPTQR